MVSEENRAGLYITVPVYFMFLGGAAYWAYKRTEHMKHEGVNDKVGNIRFNFRTYTYVIASQCILLSLLPTAYNSLSRRERLRASVDCWYLVRLSI
jgi:hypothetical protein